MNKFCSKGDEYKKRAKEKLDKAFEILNTVLELKLAFLRKTYPDRDETDLIEKIYLDVIKNKGK